MAKGVGGYIESGPTPPSTDIRLTMNVNTDARIFDLAGAMEKLSALPAVSATSSDSAG